MSFIPGANVGPYRIVEQAERNGLATTYTAYQPAQGRYVSVVAIPNIPRDDVPLLRQRQRQLELITSLRHPNILTVHDHGEHLGVAFLVTELIEAEPLSARLGAPWPLSEVTRVLRPVAEALDDAHGQGVVHGDVRASMVLLTPDGTPILGGFGLTVQVASSADETPTLRPGQRIRPAHEDIAAGQRRDRRGLALIAYEMLTGRAVEVDGMAVERPLPPAQLGSPLLAPPVERVLLRELSGEPSERYPTSTAFVDALAEPLAPPATAPVGVAPAPVVEPADGGARRRWMTVGLVIAAVAVLGIIALISRNAGLTPSIADIRATATANAVSGTTVPGGTGIGAAATGAGAGPASTSGSPATGSGAASAGSAASGGTAARTAVPGSGASASGTGAAGAGSSAAGGTGVAGTGVAGTGSGTTAAGAGTSGASAQAGATREPGSAGATAARPGGIALIVPSTGPLSGTPSAVILPAAGATATGPRPGAAPGAGTGSSAGPGSVAAAATPRPAGQPAPAGPAATPRPVSTRIPATWRVDGDASGRWSLDEQGRLLGHVEDGASLLLFPESHDDIDYSAMVNTTTCQSTLVFRAQDSENLLFAIYIPDGLPAAGSAGGGIWLYQRVEGLDLPIRTVRPSTMRPAGEPVKLRIVTSGAQIMVSLNDEPAIQAVDTAVRSGKLGTMVYSPGGKTCETTYGDIQR